jgi:hypothetical protein
MAGYLGSADVNRKALKKGKFAVIASQRVARTRARWQAQRSNPEATSEDWIASSLRSSQ